MIGFSSYTFLKSSSLFFFLSSANPICGVDSLGSDFVNTFTNVLDCADVFYFRQYCRSVCGLDARAAMPHWHDLQPDPAQCHTSALVDFLWYTGYIGFKWKSNVIFRGCIGFSGGVINRFGHDTEPEERTDHVSHCVFVGAFTPRSDDISQHNADFVSGFSRKALAGK